MIPETQKPTKEQILAVIEQVFDTLFSNAPSETLASMANMSVEREAQTDSTASKSSEPAHDDAFKQFFDSFFQSRPQTAAFRGIPFEVGTFKPSVDASNSKSETDCDCPGCNPAKFELTIPKGMPLAQQIVFLKISRDRLNKEIEKLEKNGAGRAT